MWTFWCGEFGRPWNRLHSPTLDSTTLLDSVSSSFVTILFPIQPITTFHLSSTLPNTQKHATLVMLWFGALSAVAAARLFPSVDRWHFVKCTAPFSHAADIQMAMTKWWMISSFTLGAGTHKHNQMNAKSFHYSRKQKWQKIRWQNKIGFARHKCIWAHFREKPLDSCLFALTTFGNYFAFHY